MSNRISPQGYSYGEDPTSTNPFWDEDYYNDLDATATVDDTSGNPAVRVTKTMSADGTTVFNFAFTGLVGEGDEGPAGPTGPQGPAGPQGEDGEQGEQGEPGVTPNITVEATVDSTTGTPDVTVTKTGTDEEPVYTLAFSGIKGETGATGAQGQQGVQGVPGNDGITPSITMTASTDTASSAIPTVTVTKTGTDANPNFHLAMSGFKGAQGETGPQGPQGPQGLPGEVGNYPDMTISASADNTHSASPSVIVTKTGTDAEPNFNFAFSGFMGETGATGATGANGVTPVIAMTATTDGTSSENPTVTVTKSGTDAQPSYALAFSGLKGETGATGATGAQGPQGEQGPQGIQGIQGIQGPQGEQGPAGNDGADGTDGITPTITATATSDNTHSATPTVTVTKSGTDVAPSFAFAFSGLMGETGATGATGPQGPAGPIPVISYGNTSTWATFIGDLRTGTPVWKPSGDSSLTSVEATFTKVEFACTATSYTRGTTTYNYKPASYNLKDFYGIVMQRSNTYARIVGTGTLIIDGLYIITTGLVLYCTSAGVAVGFTSGTSRPLTTSVYGTATTGIKFVMLLPEIGSDSEFADMTIAGLYYQKLVSPS